MNDKGIIQIDQVTGKFQKSLKPERNKNKNQLRRMKNERIKI